MKISVDEVFMHYFQIVSALGLRWEFCPQTQNLPTPGKDPVDAHTYSKCMPANSRAVAV